MDTEVMRPYEFQLELEDGSRESVLVTKDELTSAGWFEPGMTDDNRWLLLATFVDA